MSLRKPFHYVVGEEIALEGLEGITLSDLFTRLCHHFGPSFAPAVKFKALVWKHVIYCEDFEFFCLPEPRPILELIDRSTLDGKTESKKVPVRYTYCPIDTPKIRGSCQDYDKRTKLDRNKLNELTWTQIVDKYGQTLVIVASQDRREEVIMCRKVEKSLTIAQYCALERIGRARELGEVISGKYSLGDILKSLKSGPNYAMIYPVQEHLVVKQDYSYLSDNSGLRGLFHLPQFWKEYRNEHQNLTINAVQFLKNQPQFCATSQEMKDAMMGEPNAVNRCIKHADMRALTERYVVNYRQYYPNATPKEWQCKNKTERVLQMFRLKTPEIEIWDLFKRKDDEEAEDESPFLVKDNQYADGRNLQRQVYVYIESKATEGAVLRDVRIHFGLSKLNTRLLLRNIEKLGLIQTFFIEVGRQKMAKYVAKKFNVQHEILKPADTEFEPEPEPVEESFIYEGMDLDSIPSEITFTKVYGPVQEQMQGIRKLLESNAISGKTVKRSNQIIQILTTRKIIHVADLCRKLQDKEKAAGYKETLDRKSLARILGRLAADDYLKFLNLKVDFKDKTHSVVFACTAETQETEECVQGAIRKFKARFVMKNLYDEHPHLGAKKEKKKETKEKELSQFTSAPKFVRMRNLHEFLYHTIHVMHRNQQPLSNKAEIVDTWISQNPNIESDSLLTELPNIYSEFLDWRAFIEPATPQNEQVGTYLLEALIFNMPLSIFLTLHNSDLTVPELREVMLHPIKRHLTLKHSPNVVRAQLGYHKTSSYNILLVARHLAYIGLLQFATAPRPDQFFIYLNRKACLYDTVSSCPAYHKIEEKEYPRKVYTFDSMEVVERYWTNMITICADTKLNSRTAVDGKDLLIETIQGKKYMETLIEPKSNGELIKRDTGEIPGDRLGAAGLDSALYSHLSASWVRTAKRRGKHSVVKEEKPTKTKLILKQFPHKTKSIVAIAKVPNKHRFMRKIETKKMSTKRLRKLNFDKVDENAMGRMKHLRVSWSEEEAQTLLICRLAIMYLRPQGSVKHYLPAAYRDILHWRHESGVDKSKFVCHRHMINAIKHRPDVKTVLQLSLAEIRQNSQINQRYGEDFIENLKQVYPNEKDFIVAFRTHFVNLTYLLSHMYKNLSPSTDYGRALELPDNLRAFRQLYVITPNNTEKLAADPQNKEEIEVHQLASLLHSFLCSHMDKTSWHNQILEIYKNYSDDSMKKALADLRGRQVVSMNKRTETKYLEGSRRAASLPIHLSSSYRHHVTTKLPYETFDQAFYTILEIGQATLIDTGTYTVFKSSTGTAVILAEIINQKMLQVQLEAPKLVVQMEQIKEENFASYERIYPRFHELIKHMKMNQIRPERAGTSKASDPSVGGPAKIQFVEEITYRYHPSPIETLMKYDHTYYHFFCLLRSLHQEVLSQTFSIDDLGRCSFNCVLFHNDPIDAIIAVCIAHKTVIRNIHAKQGLRDKTDFHHKHYVIKEDTLMHFYARLIERLRTEQSTTDKTDFGSVARNLPDANHIIELAFNFVNNPETRLGSYLKKIDSTRSTIFDCCVKDEEEDDRQYEMIDKLNKHADIFRVNLGKMMINLKDGLDKRQEKLEEFAMPHCLMFLTNEKRDQILDRIKKSAIWPTFTRNKTELRKVLQHLDQSEVASVEDLLTLIKSHGDEGIHAVNLLLVSSYPKPILIKYMKILVSSNFVLRTGITNVTYIHWTCIQPWLIKSYNIKRLERESIPTASTSLMNIEDRSAFGKRMAELDTLPKAKRARISIENVQMERQSVATPREAILIVTKPWVRVNGSINRRALDKWLGTILLHLVHNPGISLKLLGERFTFLTVMQVRDCLDILVDLECIELVAHQKPAMGLFSDYENVQIEPATDFHAIDSIFVTVQPNAIGKLTFFIGKKKYTTEFVN